MGSQEYWQDIIVRRQLSDEDKEAIHHLWDIVNGEAQSVEDRIAGHHKLDDELATLETKYGRKFTPTKYAEQRVIKRVGDWDRPPLPERGPAEVMIEADSAPRQSSWDIMWGILGEAVSEYLNPNRPRNAFIDTNAFYLTAGGQSSIDKLAIDIEKHSVWKLMR